MREIKFVNNEYYHIYNRGTDKRIIFIDEKDFSRFIQSMEEFNKVEPIGSLYERSFLKLPLGRRTSKFKLINIICYCLNFNHYHLILEQNVDGGISEFIKRLAGGYTKYFNLKHKRSGVLFQGKFKAVYIDTNEYLLHVSAYINLNNRVHKLKKLSFRSSWAEYIGTEKYKLCEKSIILDQFKNPKEYKEFAEDTLVNILERKSLLKELEELLLE